MLVIQPLQFLMMSVNACFNDFTVPLDIKNWTCDAPFIRIKSGSTELISTTYKPPEKKSKRGRKKKIRIKKSDFKSNISFILNQDKNNKVKNYNIRIFNGGNIVCVGILKENLEDFYFCLNEVKKYIITQKLNEYKHFNLPKEFFESMAEILDKNYSVHSVESTLVNYQFSVNYYINIFKLKSFFTDSSTNIINIDFDKFYNFITRKIMSAQNDYNLNPDILLSSLSSSVNDNIQIKKTFVKKDRFINILKTLDLQDIKLSFTQYWTKFLKRQEHRLPKSLLENIKYSLLKQFFINCFEPFKKSLQLDEYSLVENIRFKEAKNTLLIEKKKNTCSITIRVFGTGIINLQGANNRIAVEEVYKDIIQILTELSDKVLYNPNMPPICDYERFLI